MIYEEEYPETHAQKTDIIFISIQASGKSTFDHERFKDYAHINLDTLHTRNKEKSINYYELPPGEDYREFVLRFLDEA